MFRLRPIISDFGSDSVRQPRDAGFRSPSITITIITALASRTIVPQREAHRVNGEAPARGDAEKDDLCVLERFSRRWLFFNRARQLQGAEGVTRSSHVLSLGPSGCLITSQM